MTALSATYFDAQHTLRAEAFATFDSFLSRAAALDHDLRCYDDVLGFVAEVRDRARRTTRIAKAFPRGVRDRAGRSLIGDEMGLGKTVQAIAAAEIMAREFGVERVLVVCPTSPEHQWEREIARFTDRKTTVIGGLRARREHLYADATTFFTITNYDTVHSDLDLIGRWSPDLVVLDEAQRIKNWNTRTARSVKRIASPYAIVLTGTPLENRLEELVSIVEFIDKHRLGPTFKFLAEHQVRDEHDKVVGYRHLDRIGTTLSPMLIRRAKSQVLADLPQRLDKNVFVPMTPSSTGTTKRIARRWHGSWRSGGGTGFCQRPTSGAS